MIGVYIKGMEMPKHCFNCSTKVDPDNRRCNIDGHIFEETLEKLTSRRDENCPLIYIPPHGRLGDIDKLAKRIEYERYHHAHTDGLAARHHIAEYSHFLEAIADTPTIIPAEGGDAE